jgi:hypothetical protein
VLRCCGSAARTTRYSSLLGVHATTQTNKPESVTVATVICVHPEGGEPADRDELNAAAHERVEKSWRIKLRRWDPVTQEPRDLFADANSSKINVRQLVMARSSAPCTPGGSSTKRP